MAKNAKLTQTLGGAANNVTDRLRDWDSNEGEAVQQ